MGYFEFDEVVSVCMWVKKLIFGGMWNKGFESGISGCRFGILLIWLDGEMLYSLCGCLLLFVRSRLMLFLWVRSLLCGDWKGR